MEFAMSNSWIWLCAALLGWGTVFFIKYRSPIYLKNTDSFGENVAVYFSLLLKMLAGLVFALIRNNTIDHFSTQQLLKPAVYKT